MGCHCFDAEQSITLSHSSLEVQRQVLYIHVEDLQDLCNVDRVSDSK
jgi:hypothetical protein